MMIFIFRFLRIAATRLKTFAEQIRCLDKERPPVSAEARLANAGIRIVAVVVQIIVIACVKSRSRTRRPPDDELRANARRNGRVINPQPRKRAPCKLISRAQAKDIIVKSRQSRIVTNQPDFIVIQLRLKG